MSGAALIRDLPVSAPATQLFCKAVEGSAVPSCLAFSPCDRLFNPTPASLACKHCRKQQAQSIVSVSRSHTLSETGGLVLPVPG